MTYCYIKNIIIGRIIFKYKKTDILQQKLKLLCCNNKLIELV